jgi:DNA replication protein DnaC
MNIDFQQAEARMRELYRNRREAMLAALAREPQTKHCDRHPKVSRPIDFDLSGQASTEDRYVAVYARCPQCAETERREAEERKLHRAGVPAAMLHCTLENWTPGDEKETEALKAIRDFIQTRRGFLVMLGSIGTGKSHLAVAACRFFRNPLFVKQSSLLLELRRSYRDREAPNPIPRCQAADLLALDEMGLSAGGRDELPMLHEILDHRYQEFLPTILTGNVTREDLRAVLGERLTDRVKQSAFRIIEFAGDSHRANHRDLYFASFKPEIKDELSAD